MYDVRGIANLVIARAEALHKPVTNLSLNKIVYFLHEAFLHNYRTPLVTAKIEAWTHGPVFRELYHQFKIFGPNAITRRAQRIDPILGIYSDCDVVIDAHHADFLVTLCEELLTIPAGKLVDMSHVSDGPWHAARYSGGRLNPGMKITDESILQHASEQLRH